MTWFYKDVVINSVEDMPDDVVGFVYEITHIPSGKKYIGKKILKHKRTKPPLKGYKRRRVTYVESDWKTYVGSNEDTKRLLSEGCMEDFHREILYFCKNKKNLSYLETKELFNRNVLESDVYFNSNIMGKFFRKDTQ